MSYTIYALENTQARLVIGKTETTSKEIADIVAAVYASQGHIVKRMEEL
jgi:hypothetical protein